MVNLAKGAIEVGKNFETSMSQVAATMGITSEEIANGSKEFEMLAAKAKEMGASTKYTASEAAEGLNILAMAGLNATEATGAIGDVLNLAGAGAMSLEQSASYLTGAVKGFNDEMSNSGYYADLMAKGATMANTSVSGLGEALSGVAATTKGYNQTAESTTLALLRLAEQNVTGSEAATAMARAMADLYTPTDKAAKALTELGINVFDETTGAARDFNEVVDELNAKLSGYSDEQRLAYESTIFTTFGMKAFQKMTVSSTEKVEEFKKGLKEAAGSAMQQYATQTDNLEGKMAILNSALEATGIAIYEIFGDELKDAVGGATDAVDRLRSSIESGELRDSFEHLSKSFADFLESAITLGEKALPVVISALSFLIDNLGPLAAGWVAYNTIMLATEAATIATTIATEGLTAALGLSPIGLIAIAAAAAVGGIVALGNAFDDAGENATEMARAIEHSNEALIATKDGYADQSRNAGELAKKIKELNSIEKLSAKNKIDLAAAVSQWNEIVDENNQLVLDNTGHIEDNTGALEKNLDAALREYEIGLKKEELEQIVKDYAEAQKNLADAQAKVTELEEQQALQEEELRASFQGTEEELQALLEASTDYSEAIKEGNGIVNEAQAVCDEYAATYEELVSEIEEGTPAIEEASTATTGLTEAEIEAAAAAEELQEKVEKETESLASSLAQQVTSFDEVTKAAEVHKEDIIKNLEDQNKAIEEWSANMQILADRGINEGILEKLAGMGPQGAGYVQAFVDMSGDELQRAAELWQSNLALSDSTAAQLVNEYMVEGTKATQAWIDGAWQEAPQVASLADEYVNQLDQAGAWEKLPLSVQEKLKKSIDSTTETAKESEKTGKQMADSTAEGYEKGQEENRGIVEEATRETTDAIKNTVQDELLSGSGTSEFAVQEGQGIDDGLNEGMESRRGEVDTKGHQIGATAKEAIEAEANYDIFYELGVNAAEGFAEGLGNEDSLKKTKENASALAEAASETPRKDLKIESPSKVMREIGAFAAAGFSKGLEDFSIETQMGKHIQAQLDHMVESAQTVSGAGGEYNQTVNVYSKAMTPDELAREIRLETKYGFKES